MTKNYSPNFNPVKRKKNRIKYLIFHYTGMKSDKVAVKKLTNKNSNVSCHYFITITGKIIQKTSNKSWKSSLREESQQIIKDNIYLIGGLK